MDTDTRPVLTRFHRLEPPAVVPALDSGFRPAVLTNRRFVADVQGRAEGVRLVLGLEQAEGSVSHYSARLLPERHPLADDNYAYAERLLKFLLWQRGAWKVYVAGPRGIFEHLRAVYSTDGERAFDAHFMGTQVYLKPFTVVYCEAEEIPAPRESHRSLGRHLEGCRIGFDLGASDLKISAVIDGRPVFSQEIEWHPREQTDPAYHKRHILDALRLAASKMPRLDAIGGSSAGVYIRNRPMVASLFRGIAPERFDEIRNLFLEIRDEMRVPLEVVNDGEVAALAGSMSLDDSAILGLALGSSQAAGYVTPEGKITDWLNELAFAPVDFAPDAPVDEWSRDRGCGASYFSQQCVFRLTDRAGISLPSELSPAKKLEWVQERLEAGSEGAMAIWQTMGVYLGYGIAHYADFYDMRHVLLLGRCTSGRGGRILLEEARGVLACEFPELAKRLSVQLPDERSRRVGQAIAAASLPEIGEKASL
ncbi:MAG TPA: ROK family protein [Anaerolineales bacterium]|nr:ROK family protein [Anaerolineales bacterium]